MQMVITEGAQSSSRNGAPKSLHHQPGGERTLSAFPCLLCCHATRTEELWDQKEKGYKENWLCNIMSSAASPGVWPCCQDWYIQRQKGLQVWRPVCRSCLLCYRLTHRHSPFFSFVNLGCDTSCANLHTVVTFQQKPWGMNPPPLISSLLLWLLSLKMGNMVVASMKVRTSGVTWLPSWPDVPKSLATGCSQPSLPSATLEKKSYGNRILRGPRPASVWEDVLGGSTCRSSSFPASSKSQTSRSQAEAAGHTGKFKNSEISE